jgi:hypothetical protein
MELEARGPQALENNKEPDTVEEVANEPERTRRKSSGEAQPDSAAEAGSESWQFAASHGGEFQLRLLLPPQGFN